MKYTKRLVISLILLLLFMPQNAYAYLDAGTTSYILSLLVAAFIGTLVYIKVIWKKITLFFKEVFNLLREIRDFGRFFWKIKNRDKSIVFYAEHEGYYRNFEGLIKELINNNGQTLRYVTSDPNDTILLTSEPRLNTFYLKKLLPFFMVLVNCKVFVMTLTDLNQFHLKRSVNPVHYVYVFHSPISTHLKYLHGAFDHYDSILCVGPHHIREIRKHEELHKIPSKELIKAGYYPLEQIYSKYQNCLSEKLGSTKKTKVLIAPSWGDNNVLESCGEYLIELLLGKGYEVIARPHPETVRRHPKLINRLVGKFGNNPAFTLERSVSSFDSLLLSDILICDSSGVALEYSFGTGRPVLFLDIPCMVRNKNYKELDLEVFELSVRTEIGMIVSPEKLDTIPQIIEEIKSKQLQYRECIARLREQSVYAFGHSSKIGAQHILDIIRKKQVDEKA